MTRPSEDVLRIVHAFGDKGRKDDVRALAARVRATEDEVERLRALLDMGEESDHLLPHGEDLGGGWCVGDDGHRYAAVGPWRRSLREAEDDARRAAQCMSQREER